MRRTLLLIAAVMLFVGCTKHPTVRYALRAAGKNRAELQRVIEHYHNADPELKKAARYVIASLPGHYSYRDDKIHDYYNFAHSMLINDTLSPERQRDLLRDVTDSLYSDLPQNVVSDVEIVKSDFLIHSIDLAYSQWKNCPWAMQVTFSEFLDFMLPYKAIELQELDDWRDTLYNRYSKDLEQPVINDVEYNTTMGIADYIRTTVQNRTGRYGLYDRSGLPLLSADTEVWKYSRLCIAGMSGNACWRCSCSS